MSIIRLFTAGTHNGLTFTNENIGEIAQKTADFGEEQIPFVLGHPQKNLPILGFLPKAALRVYKEGTKTSIGFDKDKADMSEESMEVLRNMGNNKLSPRLVEGVIRHIGLVEKAAVAENNAQDFAALTGTFAAHDNLFENASKGLSNLFKNPFKKNKDMAEEPENTRPDGLAEIKANVDSLTESVKKLTELTEAQAKKETDAAKKAAEEAVKADFAAAEYSHLTDTERRDFAAMCVQLPADQQIKFKESIKAMARRPQTPGNGSVTAEFGAKGKEGEKSADEILRQQYASFGK